MYITFCWGFIFLSNTACVFYLAVVIINLLKKKSWDSGLETITLNIRKVGLFWYQK
jgi:hypothetical protein